MASSPATRETALLMPEAVPERASGTAAITVVVRGATNSAIPAPITVIGNVTATRKLGASPRRTKSISAAAVSSAPAPIGSRGPTRS